MAEPKKQGCNKVARDSKGRFVKGQSGNTGSNKGGRPKKPPELKAAADEALEMLIEMMHNPLTNDKLRTDIGIRLYEWQYGKATQRVSGEEGGAAIVFDIPDALKELSE